MEQNRQQNDDQQIIVGVGASAGGVEAFGQLLEALDDAAGLTIVFVPQLDPGGDTKWCDLLAKQTSLQIVKLENETRLRTETVYVCPLQTLLEIQNGFVSVLPNEPENHSTRFIDHFLHSLANDQGERAVGIILSGAGSDGTLGLKAISDSGGLTFAQEPKSAKFDSMPRSAVQTGVADHVLTPVEIARELLQYRQHLHDFGETASLVRLQDQIEDSIPQITEILHKRTSHNFQHYKISTLSRRIQRRMQVLKIATADAYVTFLQDNDDETRTLFRELLIGVTAFFRDPDAFVSLAENVLPTLFEKRAPGESVRIWVPGCANGAEAFTLAMLCREVMDEMNSPPEVQIFATDIDERALQIARAGIYPSGIEDQITPERLKRFFVKRGKQYQVTKEIRDIVLFSVHNLISDSPFSRLDLISCRNLLIYLGPHLQNKLIPLFHYALRPSGYLFLGSSENITAHGELFRPLDPRFRISQRKGTAVGSTTGFGLRQSSQNPLMSDQSQPDTEVDLTNIRQRILLDEFSPKSCVIDESGQILNAAANMQKYLTLSDGDFQNNIIKIAARGLRLGLRTAIAEAKKTRRKVQHENLSVRDGDQTQRVLITVQPMPRLGEEEGLFMVVFHDVGLPVRRDEIDESLTQSSQDADSMIAQLEQELEATREDLEKSMQDMEAANQELKSSNEELLSINEELQSANEELESSREEISIGIERIARANTDLENLLRSTQIATVFLDEQRLIRSFTPAITEIYSLISADVGRPLEHFVPLVEQMPPLPDLESIQKGKPVEDTVVSNTGKSFIRRVLPYQTYTGHYEGIVVTFVDVTDLQNSQELFQLLVDASAQIVWITNAEGVVTEDSPSWRAFTGQAYDQWINQGWLDVVHEEDREATIQNWQSVVAKGETFSVEYRLWHHSGEWRWVHVRAVPQRSHDGSILRWVGMNTDITKRKQAEQEILESRQQLSLGVEVAHLGLGRVDYRNNLITLSAEAAALYGLGHDEMTVTREEWQSTFHPDDREAVEAQVQEHLVPGSDGHCDLDYRIVMPTGEIRWISARKQVYFDRNDHFFVPAYAILVAQDITDRKRAELNLAFLADFQTQLIPLTSVADLMEVATRQTAEYLNLSRCLIVEFDAEVENADILFEHHATALKTIVGRHPVKDFHSEDERNKLLAGHQFFLSDTQHDLQDARLAEKYRAIGVGAYCNSAYVTERGVKFVVSALKPDAYVWRADELDLLQEIANRLCIRIEHARTETELVDREAHLRRVINNQLGLVGVIGRDGKLLEVDDDSMRIAGLTRDDVIGKHFAECAWWTYDPAIAQKMRDSMEKGFAGEVVRFDVPLYAAGLGGAEQRLMIDFMMAPVFDEHGEVEHLIPSGVDISDRVVAENLHKETAFRLESMFNSAVDGMITINAAGIMDSINPAASELFGYSAEELTGQNVKLLMPEPWHSEHDSYLSAYLKTGQAKIIGSKREVRGRRKDGSTFAMELAVSEALMQGEKLFVGTVRDISERKRRELNHTFMDELQKLLEQSMTTAEMMPRSCKQIVEYMDLSRCLLIELDEANRLAEVIYEYAQNDLPSIVGVDTLADFFSEQELKPFIAGQPVVINDTQSATRPAKSAEQFAALQIGSILSATYVSEQRLKFVLVSCRQQPYHWQADDIKLHQEIASRMFARLDRARAEEALRESESRFRDLADNMSQFAWMADEQGLIFWYNKRWFEYTGTTLEEMQGWGWKKVQHPDHVDRVVKRVQHSWDTGEIWEDTFPLRSKEGDYRWFLSRAVPIRDHAGNILRWFGTNTDITERKQAELAIKLSEERLRSAAEAAGFGMLHVDLVEDTVSYSPEMKRMLGLPEDAEQHVHANDLPDWIHPDDREAYAEHFRKLTVLPENVSNSLDHRIIRPDGETRWVRLHVKPVFTGMGAWKKATQIIGTLLDITSQREFEQSLKEAREMAEAANEAKSAFLANMSHEIRTPMTAILGYADLVSDLVENEEAAAHLRTIRHNGDFLLDIINDILDLSKIEAGKLDIIRERFAPDRLVEDVRSIMEVRATENQLQLDVTYQGRVPAEIESDPKRLKQILINLVGNAIKFTMKGCVKLVVSYSNRTLQFEIIDSGIGMTKHQQKRLFQPFSQGDHTVNREFGGTGLGLAISQRLAAMLGGEISVESESGKGSTFTVTIDTGDLEGVKMIQPRLNAESVDQSESTEEFILKCHVLVVDDRRDIRFLSRRFLTQAGAKVTEAVDGEQAVDVVTEAMRKEFAFDLILLDMQMPKLDGYESARQLRKLGYTGPIIALTADAMQGDMTRCIECGCNDYLSKPIDRFLLLQMVQRYVNS
ncbi:PAS domain S-box protein [uncultured Gimesia sp.]|uniref:PAS domain S-box protein n=1 Tax=uncultured Gimesia sp. TaxID=1678688 RepID=UPI002633E803|nr:PAS domain S-box protein [uncultured Gimesia sp.]